MTNLYIKLMKAIAFKLPFIEYIIVIIMLDVFIRICIFASICVVNKNIISQNRNQNMYIAAHRGHATIVALS